MKKLLTFSLIIFAINSIAQTAISDVAGYTPNAKAVLDINSTSKGLLLPRLTTAQRIAIAPTATQAGLTVFDTNTKSQWFFDGTVWKEMAGGFALPYTGTNNNGSNALDINNTVGRAAYFQSPNSSETMRVYNSGTGNAITVDGHLNVTGTIKANDVDGTAGQVLMKNNLGSLAWSNICDYKNFRVFEYTSSTTTPTFTVPAGVTKIRVQQWGAGGRGFSLSSGNTSSGAGGGGGGYLESEIDVLPAMVFNVIVGQGATEGDGGTSGGNTILGMPTLGYSIYAYGGNNAFGIASAMGAGEGGSFNASYLTSAIGLQGNAGATSSISRTYVGTATLDVETIYGNGGDAGNSPNTGGQGRYLRMSGGTILSDIYGGGHGKVPGGGGSATIIVGHNQEDGANGRMIIYW